MQIKIMAIFPVLFFAASFPDYIQTQMFDPYFGIYSFNNPSMNLYNNPYMYPIGYGHYYSSSSSDWQPWTGGGFNRGINTPNIGGSFNQINPFLNPFYPNNNNLINSGIFGLQTPPPTPPSNNNPFGNLLSALIGPPPPPPPPPPTLSPTLSPLPNLFQPNFGETTNGNNNMASSLSSPFGRKFRLRLGGGGPSSGSVNIFFFISLKVLSDFGNATIPDNKNICTYFSIPNKSSLNFVSSKVLVFLLIFFEHLRVKGILNKIIYFKFFLKF
ncbi:unnamed protein product [Meloidogyne enterolobii]|uniref:Uncharacterized protein n=2 Tax=Meloidogyne enterolobii TaxID=390850 RepID=A0ACB1B972_MELEN